MRILGWPPSVFWILASLPLIAAAAVPCVLWYRKRRARLLAAELEQDLRTLRRLDEFIRSGREPGKPLPTTISGESRQAQDPSSNPANHPPLSEFIPKPDETPPTLISVPCLESRSVEDAAHAGDELGRRHAAIWQMADSGRSAEEISTTTGQPIGEIELILGLRRQIQSVSAESAKCSPE